MFDRAAYNRDMRKALGSKLFFVQHVPVNEASLIVDFGCADGSLLKALSRIVAADAHLIGIDRDYGQRKAARENFPRADYWRTLAACNWWSPDHGLAILVLSSVLHELLSTSPASFDNWWAAVERRRFDFICIRDFSVPAWTREERTPVEWLNAIVDLEHSRVSSFEQRWGSIRVLYNFIHYLLKRQYPQNWEREMEENYLAMDTSQLVRATTSGAYHVRNLQITRTGHFEKTTRSQLGFCPDITTHAELVLARTEWYPEDGLSATVPVRGDDLEEREAAGGLAA